MSPSVQPEGSGVTVNAELLAVWPFTETENGPDDAPDGTIATMLVSLQFVTTALVAPNETVLLPCVGPKFVPVIVTHVPTAPDVGAIEVMPGSKASPATERAAHTVTKPTT